MYISLVQVPTAQQPRPSLPPQPRYNFSGELKQKDGVGFGVNEEEKRRKKKSAEVIERWPEKGRGGESLQKRRRRERR